MDKWILVADTNVCDLSKKQVEICKNLEIPLKGAVMCNQEENEKTPVCHNVDFFPTFCHVDSGVCVPGIRKTKEEFEKLEIILKKELEKTKTQLEKAKKR